MTAIKKSTKTPKSPAPATKAAKSTTTAKKKLAVAVLSAASRAPAPAVKPVATKPVVTTIAANVNVGFGNSLYLRGEGTGLSWDKGILMTCVADDLWQITLGESARPFTVKFLLNDATWSAGPDYTVASGAKVTFRPGF